MVYCVVQKGFRSVKKSENEIAIEKAKASVKPFEKGGAANWTNDNSDDGQEVEDTSAEVEDYP